MQQVIFQTCETKKDLKRRQLRQHNSRSRKTNEYLDWLMFSLERNHWGLCQRGRIETHLLMAKSISLYKNLDCLIPHPSLGEDIYFPRGPLRSLPNMLSATRLFLNLWQILRPSNVSWGKVSATFTQSFHHVSLHSFLASLWAFLRVMTGCNSSLATEASLGCA